jgi:hypothetical protein
MAHNMNFITYAKEKFCLRNYVLLTSALNLILKNLKQKKYNILFEYQIRFKFKILTKAIDQNF